MSAANRRRGHSAERAVCVYLREHGYPDAHTTRSALGHDGTRTPGDVEAIAGVVIEVKDVASSSFPKWREQATEEGEGRPWVIVRRRRGTPDVGEWQAQWSIDRPLFRWFRTGTFAEFLEWWGKDEIYVCAECDEPIVDGERHTRADGEDVHENHCVECGGST